MADLSDWPFLLRFINSKKCIYCIVCASAVDKAQFFVCAVDTITVLTYRYEIDLMDNCVVTVRSQSKQQTFCDVRSDKETTIYDLTDSFSSSWPYGSRVVELTHFRNRTKIN